LEVNDCAQIRDRKLTHSNCSVSKTRRKNHEEEDLKISSPKPTGCPKRAAAFEARDKLKAYALQVN